MSEDALMKIVISLVASNVSDRHNNTFQKTLIIPICPNKHRLYINNNPLKINKLNVTHFTMIKLHVYNLHYFNLFIDRTNKSSKNRFWTNFDKLIHTSFYCFTNTLLPKYRTTYLLSNPINYILLCSHLEITSTILPNRVTIDVGQYRNLRIPKLNIMPLKTVMNELIQFKSS